MRRLLTATLLSVAFAALLGANWTVTPPVGQAARGAVLASVRGVYIYEADLMDEITYAATQMELNMTLAEALSYLYEEDAFLYALEQYKLAPLNSMLGGLIQDTWLASEVARSGIYVTRGELDDSMAQAQAASDAQMRDMMDAEQYEYYAALTVMAEDMTDAFYQSKGIEQAAYTERYKTPRSLRNMAVARLLEIYKREGEFWYGSAQDLADAQMRAGDVTLYPIGEGSAAALYYGERAALIDRLRAELAARAPSLTFMEGGI